MLFFDRSRKAHHTELRVEKYWDAYGAGYNYRLIRYRFDKKNRLIKGYEYSYLGSGDKKWADAQMRHYRIKKITTPVLSDDEED